MPFDLINPSTTISRTYSKQFLAKALELGRLYGWNPLGTEPPSHMKFYKNIAEWHGRYLTNDGQTVMACDSHFLAEALDKSLTEIPDKTKPVFWDLKPWKDDDLPEWLSPEELEVVEDGLEEGLLDLKGTHPIEYFAGAEKECLIGFIRFCKLGSFKIY